MVVTAILRNKYLLAICRQKRALLKALDPLDQFESSAAHSAAIMAFKLAALLLSWAGDASLHGDGDVVK